MSGFSTVFLVGLVCLLSAAFYSGFRFARWIYKPVTVNRR